MPQLAFSRGPWDSSDYKRLLMMAPTGRGIPGVWKQSGVIWAAKDTCYTTAVRFLKPCQGLMLCQTQCISTQESVWTQLTVGAQHKPSKLACCMGLS